MLRFLRPFTLPPGIGNHPKPKMNLQEQLEHEGILQLIVQV